MEYACLYLFKDICRGIKGFKRTTLDGDSLPSEASDTVLNFNNAAANTED